jgi:uncharacterized protein (DUF1684 family)
VPPKTPSALTTEYLEGLAQWRHRKEQDLLRRDSWLALTGLHWLTEGSQTAGSGPEVDIHLPPSAPAHLGEVEVRGGRVFLRPHGSIAIGGLPPAGTPLEADTSASPTFLRVGDVTLVVIERSGRLGLRVWDNGRLKAPFAGRSWYDPDGAFIIEAAFDPAESGATIPVPTVTGDVDESPLLGTARFSINGQSSSLQSLATDDGLPWFLFADPTNGSATYPAGRFLVAGAPGRGSVTLDFNRAYNPPCAFTPYATCPLPPDGNRLTVPIEAGERYPGEH